MRDNLKKFIELSENSVHRPLTDDEYKEFERIVKEEGFEPCHNCEGEGGKDFPSMAGAGWEWLDCTVCDGSGFGNLPEEVKKDYVC